MVAFGRNPGGGRRRADRSVAPLAAVFTTIARSQAICLVDLSCTGARLRGPVLPELDEELVLGVGRLKAYATVVWAGQGQCGVSFDPPLGHTDVIQVRCQAASQGPLAPELNGALEDWTTGFAR